MDKAWVELAQLNPPASLSVKFMEDEYSVSVAERRVLSVSCNAPANDFAAIIILHYLSASLKGLPELTGEWLTFREFSGIEGYYEAFKKRCIDPIIRRFTKNKSEDAARVINVFAGIPVLIKYWKADAEFGPDANIYFDRSITRIFCTEDIVVLAGLVAGKI